MGEMAERMKVRLAAEAKALKAQAETAEVPADDAEAKAVEADGAENKAVSRKRVAKK